MAKPGERVTGSNRDVVLRYLREHEGAHRCTEVAAATGLSTHQVAIAAYGLAEQGDAVRGERPAENGGRPFKTYAASTASVGADSKDGD